MTQRILYFLVPGSNISPFDVTIAADAGFDQVIPLTGIRPENVTALVQDAVFCRPPKRFNDTGIFLGGRDVHMATDMFQSAKNAMVGDFQVGVFADPNGAYTTSAAVVALVEKAVREKTGNGLSGRVVSVFGTGPVGLCTAILAARQGAKARLCQLTADDDSKSALRFCERYGAKVEWVSAETHRDKINVMGDTEIAVSAAKAGIRILDAEVLEAGGKLMVAADTNAVPPSGVEGVGVNDKAIPVTVGKTSFLSIGPLAIGNLKYKTQFGLFRSIQTSAKAALIDFPEAYAFALEELANAK
ncbi:NAD(P)-dependent methylenetetrahydromethanopterin dehydrogenase [Methyloversatilis thermotolerans]|uniref:NAD(P)-dependent methylenetetrahydromethanopterin dehydrogenase n=1 Tax=Methyloversatilis thermotolerans TaxID=1346290 RepID=UPI000378581B|nr:NAD(P)-dependent methylenetetrahydromethanopterin dehydrogenase [Methyloversatilis thermotolerans]